MFNVRVNISLQSMAFQLLNSCFSFPVHASIYFISEEISRASLSCKTAGYMAILQDDLTVFKTYILHFIRVKLAD
jgi:hypothetical protein